MTPEEKAAQVVKEGSEIMKLFIYANNSSIRMEVLRNEKFTPQRLKNKLRLWKQRMDWIIQDMRNALSVDARKIIDQHVMSDDDALQIESIMSMSVLLKKAEKDELEEHIYQKYFNKK